MLAHVLFEIDWACASRPFPIIYFDSNLPDAECTVNDYIR